MIRGIKMSGIMYAMEFDSIEDEAENLTSFVESGDVVIIANDLKDLEDYNDTDNEIVLVEPDDN